MVQASHTARLWRTEGSSGRVDRAVQLLFVHESGTPSESVFAVGGIAVEGARWPELRDAWTAALSEHGRRSGDEIKWHGIQTGDVPPALADALFAALARSPITCFVVILRPQAARKEAPNLVDSDQSVYGTAMKFLLERFERSLARQDDFGAVVVDSRLKELDERLRRYYTRLQREGTEDPCASSGW